MGFFDDAAGKVAKQAALDQEQDDQDRFEPEAGDQLNAVLLEAKAYTKGKYEPTIILTFRNVGDDAVGGVEAGASTFMFTPTVLRRKLLDAKPKVGTPFVLRFEGTVKPKSGGNAYKDWTLVTPFTEEGDVEAQDQALWAGIEREMAAAIAAKEAAKVVNPYGGQATAPPVTGGSEWKF